MRGLRFVLRKSNCNKKGRNAMNKGKVKWFDNKKGYGFIIAEDGQEVFVHFSAINAAEGEYKSLDDGQEVTFDITKDQNGRTSASNVTKA